MDLRTTKTEQSIRTTFYTLRQKQPLEKITLSFLVGGAIHSFLSPDFRYEDTAHTIIKLLKKL